MVGFLIKVRPGVLKNSQRLVHLALRPIRDEASRRARDGVHGEAYSARAGIIDRSFELNLQMPSLIAAARSWRTQAAVDRPVSEYGSARDRLLLAADDPDAALRSHDIPGAVPYCFRGEQFEIAHRYVGERDQSMQQRLHLTVHRGRVVGEPGGIGHHHVVAAYRLDHLGVRVQPGPPVARLLFGEYHPGGEVGFAISSLIVKRGARTLRRENVRDEIIPVADKCPCVNGIDLRPNKREYAGGPQPAEVVGRAYLER